MPAEGVREVFGTEMWFIFLVECLNDCAKVFCHLCSRQRYIYGLCDKLQSGTRTSSPDALRHYTISNDLRRSYSVWMR